MILADNASFEEVVYLLWHQRLPKAGRVSRIKKTISRKYGSATRST